MIEVFCPECGSYVDEVYDDELPMTMECEVCGKVFMEDSEEEDDEDKIENDEENE